MSVAIVCLMFVTMAPPAPAQVIGDLRGPGEVEYLVVAAEDLADACVPLLAHRQAQGLRVGLARLGDVCRAYGDGRPTVESLVAFLRHAHERWRTRFVLLVGDARGAVGRVIPMRVEAARYHSDRFLSSRDLATDYEYATLGGEEIRLHVGRFSADTPAEVEAMVAKTIAYETTSAPGPWQRKVAFVAGPFGDPAIDPILETQFAQIVTSAIPPAFDVEVAYARLESPYALAPPGFHANALRMLNEGALFHVYVGHATRMAYDEIRWRGGRYPVLDTRLLLHVHIENGLPVMAAIACWTGFIDAVEGDSLGEELMKLRHGPVAFLGASRICQPYGNALLGKYMLEETFSPGLETLGEMVSAAKRRVLARDEGEFRRRTDALAAFVQGSSALEPIRQDTVRHYNLLGDPALRLQRPSDHLRLEARVTDAAGVVVTGAVPFERGTALVSLEAPRDRFIAPLPPQPLEDAPDFEAVLARRYLAANEKALVRRQTRLTGGTFAVDLPLPADVAPGEYLVKALAWDDAQSAAAALPVTLGSEAEAR